MDPDQKKKVLNSVNKKRAVDLLQGMIRIRSYTGDELKVVEFARDWMKKHGLNARLQEFAPTKYHKKSANAIGILRGSGGGMSMMLNGHLDTDPAVGNWKHDPWDPVIFDGNKINGIGTTNMKGADAAMVEAALAIKDAGIKLKGDIIIALVAEELQGGWGISKVLEEYGADAGICGEATFFDIGYNPAPGISRVQIQIYGSSAHIHELDKAADATVKMAKVITALSRLDFPHTRSVAPPKSPQMSHYPIMAIGSGRSGIGEDLYDGRPATVSDRAVIKLDVRHDVNQTEAMLVKDIQDLLDRLEAEDPQLKTKLEPIPTYITRPSYELPWDSRIIDAISKAHMDVFGKEVKRMPVLAGGADAAFMWTKAKIPTVIYGLAGYSQNDPDRFVDTADLYITTDDLVEMAEVVALCCLDICNSPKTIPRK